MGAGNGSHLLALGRDVTRSFDDLLAAVVVLVEFAAEGFEHGHERRCHCRWRVEVEREIVRLVSAV